MRAKLLVRKDIILFSLFHFFKGTEPQVTPINSIKFNHLVSKKINTDRL